MNWSKLLKGYALVNAAIAGVVLGSKAALAVMGAASPKEPGPARDVAGEVAAQDSESSSLRSPAEARRRIAACGEAPVYIYESPATLFAADRAQALPGLRREAGTYIACLEAVLAAVEESGGGQAFEEVHDDLDSRVRYVNERIRIRDRLAASGVDLQRRITALNGQFGQCGDQPMGSLRDTETLERLAAWIECRRDEREAIAVERRAMGDAAARGPSTPEIRAGLQRIDSRLAQAADVIVQAERAWAEANEARQRAVADARGAESRRTTSGSVPRGGSAPRDRRRDEGPPCTCDDARRGFCGSPATHCASAEELAARIAASRRAAARSEALRRERAAARTTRARDAQRTSGAGSSAGGGTTVRREIVHVFQGEGSTRVEACHDARASAITTAFAPLLLSHYTDADPSRDILCACRRDGDTWHCESTAVFRDVHSLAARFPTSGFFAHGDREIACSRAKRASSAITSVTGLRFVGYREVRDSDDACRCERDERFEKWSCAAESWLEH